MQLLKNKNLKRTFSVLRQATVNLVNNDPLRIAASTAFFGTFAIPAILVVILQIFGTFLNRRKFGGNIIDKLTTIIGNNSAEEIRHILLNLMHLGNNWFFAILMFVFLLFVSTTLFIIIRNSINQLWCIRLNENSGFYFNLKQRLKSLGIITMGGILLFIAFAFEGVRLFLENKLHSTIPILNGFINEVVFFMTTTLWFCIAFRFTGNGRPVWKAVILSSVFTGVLLTVGKLVMRTLLLNSNISEIYGTSGAILLVMLFIFYSSFIFYYGVSLVDAISNKLKKPIEASSHAHKFRTEAIDLEE
ncbi:YihY/virulence factor BrkB family protein [Pedobacter arcticus]|uniref:YihY/virulence factor BrkB family protein n=1 Tax=Pedobacter arcticus TaxID=752140 RepID=UPI0002F1DBAE|nr:YihY/virulence factor BrkB family protein [Pedobacter arcticus]